MAILSAVEKGHKSWNTSNTTFSKNHPVQTISASAKPASERKHQAEVSLLSSLALGAIPARMLCTRSNCKQTVEFPLNGNFAFSHEDGRFYTIICSLGQLSFSSKMKMFYICYHEVNCTYTKKIGILVMHQSTPAAPIPPRATAGHLHTLSVPGVGH